MPRPRLHRYEFATTGPDPNLQAIGGDPYGGNQSVGLPVPPVPPATNDSKHRYLFQLVRAVFSSGQRARLVGIRQYAQIGAVLRSDVTGRACPVNLDVTSPFWRFSDGNISWHLRRIGPQVKVGGPMRQAQETDGFVFGYSTGTPALLFNKTFTDLGGYAPPGAGQPLGNAFAELGTFYDLRFPWRADRSLFAQDVLIEGPCEIVLFASVQQSDASTRPALPAPTDPDAILQEDRFVINYATAPAGWSIVQPPVYTRVAGALTFEEDFTILDSCDRAFDGVTLPSFPQLPTNPGPGDREGIR